MRVSQEIHGDERLVLLAMALDRRVGPTFGELCDRGLLGDPSARPEALRKSLQRACHKFDELGITVVADSRGAETRYRIEARLTYAEPSEVTLDPKDAPDLLAAVTAYLHGSRRPYDADVRRAREKLASVMGLAASPVMADNLGPAGVAEGADTYEVLLACRKSLTPCTFAYRDAKGVCAYHTVRPFGFFDRNRRSYVVAFDETHADDDPVRVFRIDRIEAGSATPAKGTYAVPSDFDVDDYVRLPFEYGDETFIVRFTCTDDDRSAAMRLTEGRGRWHDGSPDGWLWEAVASDLDACAAWSLGALAEGLIAIGPDELLDRMAAGLERTAKTHA